MEKTLGARIAELRRAKGLTQEIVAGELGVSAQAVSKWENDISCPDIMSLPELAKLLDTTVDTLLAGEKEPEVVLLPEEKRRSIDEMMLRIKVNTGDERVRINVPLSLIKVMIDSGVSADSIIGSDVANGIDFARIMRLVESGAVGKLMDLEVSDGTAVEIVVE